MQLPGTDGLLASHPKSLSAVPVKDKRVKVCGPVDPFRHKKAFNMRVEKSYCGQKSKTDKVVNIPQCLLRPALCTIFHHQKS